jgi:hypothetical protein
MLVVGLKPGQDGAVAAIKDRRLVFSLEGEKDSHHRYERVGRTEPLEPVTQVHA